MTGGDPHKEPNLDQLLFALELKSMPNSEVLTKGEWNNLAARLKSNQV